MVSEISPGLSWGYAGRKSTQAPAAYSSLRAIDLTLVGVTIPRPRRCMSLQKARQRCL